MEAATISLRFYSIEFEAIMSANMYHHFSDQPYLQLLRLPGRLPLVFIKEMELLAFVCMIRTYSMFCYVAGILNTTNRRENF